MVEDVKGLELKLSFYAFGNVKVLEQRGIREVVRWTAECIPPNIANGTESGPDERAGLRSVACQRGYRSKDPPAMGGRIVPRGAADEALCAG